MAERQSGDTRAKRGWFRRSPASPNEAPSSESAQGSFDDPWSADAWAEEGWDDEWQDRSRRARVRPAADPRSADVDAWLESDQSEFADVTADMARKWKAKIPDGEPGSTWDDAESEFDAAFDAALETAPGSATGREVAADVDGEFGDANRSEAAERAADVSVATSTDTDVERNEAGDLLADPQDMAGARAPVAANDSDESDSSIATELFAGSVSDDTPGESSAVDAYLAFDGYANTPDPSADSDRSSWIERHADVVAGVARSETSFVASEHADGTSWAELGPVDGPIAERPVDIGNVAESDPARSDSGAVAGAESHADLGEFVTETSDPIDAESALPTGIEGTEVDVLDGPSARPDLDGLDVVDQRGDFDELDVLGGLDELDVLDGLDERGDLVEPREANSVEFHRSVRRFDEEDRIDALLEDLDVSEVDVRDVDVPEVDVPEVDVREVDVPEFRVPEVDVPEVDVREVVTSAPDNEPTTESTKESANESTDAVLSAQGIGADGGEVSGLESEGTPAVSAAMATNPTSAIPTPGSTWDDDGAHADGDDRSTVDASARPERSDDPTDRSDARSVGAEARDDDAGVLADHEWSAGTSTLATDGAVEEADPFEVELRRGDDQLDVDDDRDDRLDVEDELEAELDDELDVEADMDRLLADHRLDDFAADDLRFAEGVDRSIEEELFAEFGLEDDDVPVPLPRRPRVASTALPSPTPEASVPGRGLDRGPVAATAPSTPEPLPSLATAAPASPSPVAQTAPLTSPTRPPASAAPAPTSAQQTPAQPTPSSAYRSTSIAPAPITNLFLAIGMALAAVSVIHLVLITSGTLADTRGQSMLDRLGASAVRLGATQGLLALTAVMAAVLAAALGRGRSERDERRAGWISGAAMAAGAIGFVLAIFGLKYVLGDRVTDTLASAGDVLGLLITAPIAVWVGWRASK